MEKDYGEMGTDKSEPDLEMDILGQTRETLTVNIAVTSKNLMKKWAFLYCLLSSVFRWNTTGQG